MKLIQRTPSFKVSPWHPWRLSYTRFKGKFMGFKIIRALLGARFAVPRSCGTMLLNFKSRPEINFGPEINNGSPVHRQRNRTRGYFHPAILWGHFEFLFMFKVSQWQTQNQSQRNKDEDSIIISGCTTKWETCEFLTNLSFEIIFLTVVLRLKGTFQN